MVCQGQVVIDGLRASDEADLGTEYQRVIRQFLDGIHGIVAADVDEAIDLQFIEDREDLLIGLDVLVDLRQFESAGSQISRRCSLQQLFVQSCFDVLGQIDVSLLQQTLDTVDHAVNFVVTSFLRGPVNPCQG